MVLASRLVPAGFAVRQATTRPMTSRTLTAAAAAISHGRHGCSGAGGIRGPGSDEASESFLMVAVHPAAGSRTEVCPISRADPELSGYLGFAAFRNCRTPVSCSGIPRTAELDGLDELLDRQLAVASRHQLLDLGMKGHAMQYRARREGPWQTLPGVCLIVSGVPGGPQKEMAALLHGGSGSLITGPAALMHYSIRGGPAMDVIDVLVPATRSVTAPESAATGLRRHHRGRGHRPGGAENTAVEGPRRAGPRVRTGRMMAPTQP